MRNFKNTDIDTTKQHRNYQIVAFSLGLKKSSIEGVKYSSRNSKKKKNKRVAIGVQAKKKKKKKQVAIRPEKYRIDSFFEGHRLV